MNEIEIKQNGTELIEVSSGFMVNTEQDYKNAAEVCKDIKIRIKQVEDYFEGIKGTAYKTWKDICAKEKELLNLYAAAETDIKNKMTVWYMADQKEKQEQQEEQERYQEEEAERLLAAAIEAEEKGKTEHSDYLVEQASIMHTAKFEQPERVRVAGMAIKKTWKARIINPALVPVEFAGAMLRPINESALDKLAKASNGGMKIPGVEFYEGISLAVSRG